MNDTRKSTKVLLAAGIAAAALLAVPAVALAQGSPDTPVYADLDGDGRADLVTLTQFSPDQQRLDVDLGYGIVSTVVGEPGTPLPKVQPSVLDLDADGRSELAVADFVGANATNSSVWELRPDRGLVRVPTTDGEPLNLPGGGGVAGPSGFSCTDDEAGQRFLWVTRASLDTERSTPGAEVYDAARQVYQVRDGQATQVDEFEIVDAPLGWVRAQTNDATCGVLNAG